MLVDCPCYCHDHIDAEDEPFCLDCDNEYRNLCKMRYDPDSDYCPICGESVDLPVHDWECFK